MLRTWRERRPSKEEDEEEEEERELRTHGPNDHQQGSEFSNTDGVLAVVEEEKRIFLAVSSEEKMTWTLIIKEWLAYNDLTNSLLKKLILY